MKNYTSIKSFILACKFLKRNPEKLPIVDHLPKRYQKSQVARFKLETIAEAINLINNNWVADYADPNQKKWFAVHRHNGLKGKRAAFGFITTLFVWAYTRTFGGPRLVFSSDSEAAYFGKNFTKLHNDMLLL